jgi:hypothetical protein
VAPGVGFCRTRRQPLPPLRWHRAPSYSSIAWLSLPLLCAALQNAGYKARFSNPNLAVTFFAPHSEPPAAATRPRLRAFPCGLPACPYVLHPQHPSPSPHRTTHPPAFPCTCR